MGPTVCRCYRACLRHISLELCSTSVYSIYTYIYISIRCFFLLGTTWTRSFCGELAVTLTLKRRPTPRHFLRSAVHLRRLCHVNANVLPDNVTTPWKYYGKSLSRDSWYEKIRLDNTNSSSILERSRKRSISYFWGWREILIRIMKIFLWRIVAIFFSLQINKRKIQMGTMNYYGCLEFNFWNDEKYYFETFLWKMIVTFFFFSWWSIKSIQMERRWIIAHVCE